MFPGNTIPARGAIRSLLPIARSYAASGGSLIISAAAQLATFAILARALGVHEFSLFVAITAVANVAVHMCGLGGMECLVRRVARDRSIYGAMLGHNIILTAASGVVLVAAGAAVLPFFFTLSPDPATNSAIIAVMLVTNIILVRAILLVEQIFIAHGDYAMANMMVIGFALARTAAVAVACLGFGIDTVAQWALWQFAAHLLVALAFAVVVRRLGPPVFRIVREELPQGVFFSVPFILHAVRQNADLLVLSLVAPAEVMSSYSLARRMLESSYLAVEALNRLLYPTLARAAVDGIHNAVPVVRKVAAAAGMISLATAVAVYMLAPVLPYIFGAEYVSLASGYQAQRAMVRGFGSVAGAALTAWATWYSPPAGTFISFYIIEFMMVVASWRMFARLVRDDRATSARRQG
jgi:O-antigen/teichoic acid export membrane protein